MFDTKYQAGLRTIFKSRVARQILTTFGSRCLAVGLSVFTSVLTARVLGPEGQGLYTVYLSTVMTSVQLFSLGLPGATTNFSARRPRLAETLLKNSSLVAVTAALVALSTFWCIDQLGSTDYFKEPEDIFFLAIWVLVELKASLLGSLFLGLKRFRLFNLLEICRKLAFSVSLLGLLITDTFEMRNVLLSAIVAQGTVLSFFFLKILTSLRIMSNQIGELSLKLFLQTLSYGKYIYAAALFSFLTLRVDIFMLKEYIGDEEVGFYSAAVSMAEAFYLLPVTVGMVLFSKFSSEPNFQSKLTQTHKVLVLMGSTLIFVLLSAFFVKDEIVKLVFGSAYLPATTPLAFLLPAVFFLSLATVLQNLLATHKIKTLMIYGPLSGFFVNLLLNCLLIQKYSSAGAAFASAMSYCIWFLVSLKLSRK